MFNDSLLAKQAWRLLHDKSSLFYKVFKACFFPNSTIMEATDSRMGSYAWKSILRGRDIIQRGALWRIGNGEKINISLPRKHPTQLLHCPLESFEDHTVATLFDPITRRRNEELVDGLFVTEDADLIKKIPLSRNVAEDTLYWPFTPSGNYSLSPGINFSKRRRSWNQISKHHQSVRSGCGRKYGRCEPLQRLKIFFGGLAIMLCQQNRH